MPPIEEIEAAANVLEALFNERAYEEIPDEATAFLRASDQLRLIAKRRKATPPKVIVRETDIEYNVYVERGDGAYLVVDVSKRGVSIDVRSHIYPGSHVFSQGTQVWGPTA